MSESFENFSKPGARLTSLSTVFSGATRATRSTFFCVQIGFAAPHHSHARPSTTESWSVSFPALIPPLILILS